MKHQINPSKPLAAQLRAVGLNQPCPAWPKRISILYRFFDRAGRLLYVGITVNPPGRWQAHKRKAVWWPLVDHVAVEWHLTEAPLDEEVAVIRSEHPIFNKRSVMSPGQITDPSRGEWKRKGMEGMLLTSSMNLHLVRASGSMDGRQAAEGWSRCQ